MGGVERKRKSMMSRRKDKMREEIDTDHQITYNKAIEEGVPYIGEVNNEEVTTIKTRIWNQIIRINNQKVGLFKEEETIDLEEEIRIEILLKSTIMMIDLRENKVEEAVT